MEPKANSSGNVGAGISGFMLGILAGAIVAGAVTLLYSPKSGPELRDKIKDEVSETRQMFRTWMNDIRDRIDSIAQIFRTEIKKSMEASGNGHRQEHS